MKIKMGQKYWQSLGICLAKWYWALLFYFFSELSVYAFPISISDPCWTINETISKVRRMRFLALSILLFHLCRVDLLLFNLPFAYGRRTADNKKIYEIFLLAPLICKCRKWGCGNTFCSGLPIAGVVLAQRCSYLVTYLGYFSVAVQCFA